MSAIGYCSDDDAKMCIPPPARAKAMQFIPFWRQVAESWIHDQFEESYKVPFSLPVNEKIRFACALYTAHLLLINECSEFNESEEKGDKNISISQVKKWQALDQIKNFKDKKYFDKDMEKQDKSNTRSNLVKIGTGGRLRKLTQRNHCILTGESFS